MKHKMVIFGLAAIAAGALSSCGSDSGPAATVPPPGVMTQTQSLDTEQVLAQAKVTSETADPYALNGGLLALTDTSESTDAASINGT